jgi:hypothetical protein
MATPITEILETAGLASAPSDETTVYAHEGKLLVVTGDAAIPEQMRITVVDETVTKDT